MCGPSDVAADALGSSTCAPRAETLEDPTSDPSTELGSEESASECSDDSCDDDCCPVPPEDTMLIFGWVLIFDWVLVHEHAGWYTPT